MRYKLGRKLEKLSDIMFLVALVTNVLILFCILTYNYEIRSKIFYIVIFVFLSFIAWVFSEGLYAIGEILIAQDEILRGQKRDTTIKKEYEDDLLVEESSTEDQGFLYKLKNNKKVFYTLVIVCVLALGGSIYSKVKYDIQHEYDGIWYLGSDLEGDSFYIDGNEVSLYIRRKNNERKPTMYQSVYKGERNKNYVTFTSCLYDYTDYDKYKTKKVHKVIYLKRINYNAFDVDGKCYWMS